jgi:hypothetical protein
MRPESRAGHGGTTAVSDQGSGKQGKREQGNKKAGGKTALSQVSKSRPGAPGFWLYLSSRSLVEKIVERFARWVGNGFLLHAGFLMPRDFQLFPAFCMSAFM